MPPAPAAAATASGSSGTSDGSRSKPTEPSGPTGSTGPLHPNASRRSARNVVWVFIAPALLAGSLIVNGAWKAGHRGSSVQEAKTALAEAYAKAPFTIRLPKFVPEDAEMVRVFMKEPDSKQGFQAYQLNVWYRTPGQIADGGGRTFHIWQTNDKFLSRRLADPLQDVGVGEVLAGSTWHRVVDDRVQAHVVTTFSRRFDDGTTMTVDSPEPVLARAAVTSLSDDPVSLG